MLNGQSSRAFRFAGGSWCHFSSCWLGVVLLGIRGEFSSGFSSGALADQPSCEHWFGLSDWDSVSFGTVGLGRNWESRSGLGGRMPAELASGVLWGMVVALRFLAVILSGVSSSIWVGFWFCLMVGSWGCSALDASV